MVNLSDKMNKLKKVRSRSKKYFNENDTPSHDWNHVQRVLNLSQKLSKKIGADLEIVKLSALLHDIGRNKEDKGEIKDHANWGARKSKEILKKIGINKEDITRVEHCIESHRYQNSIEPNTIEAKIISDADNLDALGAVGIARVFSYGGENNYPMHDPKIPMEKDNSEMGETQINHLKKKILNIKERIYTKEAKKIANSRHKYVKKFIKRFEREYSGEI